MNSRKLIVGLIIAVIFGAFLLRGIRSEEKVVQGVQSQVSTSEGNTFLSTQLKSMGEVEVEVTPAIMEPGSNMVFDVTLNTHSVDLSYDYTTIIRVEDDKGNVYKTIGWSGGEGGHHLRGQIELEPVSIEAKKIMLIVDGIDSQKEIFEWRL